MGTCSGTMEMTVMLVNSLHRHVPRVPHVAICRVWCWSQRLTSLWRVEGDRVTVGPIALLVENVHGESVLGERFEAGHDGVTPLPREGQGLAVIEHPVGIQQTPLPRPVHLLEVEVMEDAEEQM